MKTDITSHRELCLYVLEQTAALHDMHAKGIILEEGYNFGRKLLEAFVKTETARIDREERLTKAVNDNPNLMAENA